MYRGDGEILEETLDEVERPLTRSMENGLCFKCEKKGHLGKDCPPKEDKKKAPAASFTPRNMKGKDAHTHIKALVAFIDEEEKEALFKAAEEEGF